MGRRRRRRELFPPDRRLQARMLVAAVVTPLLVMAAVAAVVMFLSTRATVVLGIAAGVGMISVSGARRRQQHGRFLHPAEQPELRAIVSRLSALADLPEPEIVLHEERQPNSWMIDMPGRPPHLNVTTGLLETLEGPELEAVVAHELSHVANRDATVMTIVGGPGAVLLEGAPVIMRGGFWAWGGAAIAGAIGMLSSVGTNALSRYRELAADAGAAALTGRPAALGSALLKVSGELARLPAEDLRAAAGRNAFHLLPVADGGGCGRRGRRRIFRSIGATHPSLERRLANLERLEQRMHAARPHPRL